MRTWRRPTTGLAVLVTGAVLAGLTIPTASPSGAQATPTPASCTDAKPAVVGEFLQPAWSDAGGWSDPSRYETITTGDVNGDGRTELLGRDGVLIEVYEWAEGTDGQPDPEQWVPAAPGPQLADSAGWDGLQYSSTIQTADLDGNGTAEIVARDGDHLIAFTFTGTDLATGTWSVLPNGPAWSDAAGWDAPAQYGTIHTGDLDGNGTDDVIGLNPNEETIEAVTYDSATDTWPALPSSRPSASRASGACHRPTGRPSSWPTSTATAPTRWWAATPRASGRGSSPGTRGPSSRRSPPGRSGPTSTAGARPSSTAPSAPATSTVTAAPRSSA